MRPLIYPVSQAQFTFNMNFISLFSTLALLFPALNAATSNEGCISQTQASIFIQLFSGILNKIDYSSNSTETANAILANNFKEFSYSTLSLLDLPLDDNGDGLVYTKTSWIEKNLNAAKSRQISTLEILVSCPQEIIWMW